MCDTVVAAGSETRDGATYFGKNSDREPGEAQAVEHLAARPADRRHTQRCTWIEIPEVAAAHEVVLSRPAWMWGAEMGVNAHGLAVGNEAVFTRLKVASTGLLGMDLVRLALERATGARDALDLVCWLLAKHGQGGRAGYRDGSFRYHNAFVFADRAEAWVLETAGPYWAAEKVRGVRTISNALSIGEDADLVGPGTVDAARSLGGLRRGARFDFARAFADPWITPFTGGSTRAACTRTALSTSRGHIDDATVRAALRSHRGLHPLDGARMQMPCAHATWLPTRRAGQTTGSLVAALGATTRVLATGTSSPCLSVFKPVPLGGGPVDTGPTPGDRGADALSLWFAHERLHRTVLRDHDVRRLPFDEARRALEARALAATSPADASAAWAEHRAAVDGWRAAAERVRPRRPPGLHALFLARASRRDGLA